MLNTDQLVSLKRMASSEERVLYQGMRRELVRSDLILLPEHVHAVVWLEEWQERHRPSEPIVPHSLKIVSSHFKLPVFYRRRGEKRCEGKILRRVEIEKDDDDDLSISVSSKMMKITSGRMRYERQEASTYLSPSRCT